MIDMHQALKKASRLDFSIWRRLSLLSLGAFLLGMATTFLEVGIVSQFIQKNTFHALGLDFLIVGICSVFVGSIIVKLDRRHGYGGVPLTAFLTLVLFGLLKAVENFSDSVVPENALMIYKYLMPVMIAMSFWTIAGRFILLKLSSLKYMGVLGASLFGFFFSGYLLSHSDWTAPEILQYAIYLFIVLTVVMKILVWLLPQPSETFVRKSGGVQDSSEQKMIDCILALAFTYTTARVLGDYLLYQNLTSENVFNVLSKIWMFCGAFGFLALALLSQTRFLYTTVWGLMSLGLGFFFLAEGSFLGLSWLLYFGVVLSWICGYFYWIPYLSLLPRPLTFGQGIRLRKLRQMLMEPLGFVLVGAFVLTLPKIWLAPLLAITALLLMGLMGISVILYSHLLSRIFKMRLWCGGPLMLASDWLIRRVHQGTESDTFQDVVYFLRVMEVAHFPGFKKQLLKALHHPLPLVRLFALDKLDRHNFYKNKIQTFVRQVFQKDKDSMVRARALAFLIRAEGDYTPQNTYHKYGKYLDDSKLKLGAIMGFLQSGGECALLAMDGLQQMVKSPHKEDNLKALMIIDKVPQEGLVRLVTPLLQKNDLEVVRSALLVAGKIGHVQTLNFVFQSLDNPDLQEEALQALSLYGKKAFPPLEKMLSNPNVPLTRRKILIQFLGLLSSGEGKQVLLRNLYVPDIKMRREIFNAVLHSKITWVARSRKKILLKGIKQDVIWWHKLKKNMSVCQSAPVPALGDSFAFLRHSFKEMCQDIRGLILDQLILLKPNDLVRGAVQILRGSSSQKFVSASGILQDLLPSKLYREIRPILLAPLLEEETEKISVDVEQAENFFKQIILTPDIPVDRWMIAAALYGLQKGNETDLNAVLNKVFSCSSSVVLEAALYLLSHSKWDEKQQEEYLEMQLKKVPKNLVLDDYINHRRKNDYL